MSRFVKKNSLRAAVALATLSAPFAIGLSFAGQASAQPASTSASSLHSVVSAFDGGRVTASTVSQQNAIQTAQNYLEYTAFSRQGLIAQLEFEEFSYADAVYAVDHIEVDWNEQAAKSAKNYLEYSSFSRQGLIDQLEFEGFTPAQAEYGVTAVGL